MQLLTHTIRGHKLVHQKVHVASLQCLISDSVLHIILHVMVKMADHTAVHVCARTFSMCHEPVCIAYVQTPSKSDRTCMSTNVQQYILNVSHVMIKLCCINKEFFDEKEKVYTKLVAKEM